jgi:hypothetical protein
MWDVPHHLQNVASHLLMIHTGEMQQAGEQAQRWHEEHEIQLQ